MSLNKVLLDHKKWLAGQPGGCRANLVRAKLVGADLRNANLVGADLRNANLVRANFEGAKLVGAKLVGADLEGANLEGAKLVGADLRDADLGDAKLVGADLRNADLGDAKLRNADLRYANLQRADLRNANLGDAKLVGADLRNANLVRANFEGAKLSLFQVPDGPLTVYKSCHKRIVTLHIPAEAKRTASLIGNKCRAEYAVVVDVEDFESKGPAKSSYDAKVTYAPGETVRPLNGFSDDIRIECAPGIHFFRTREEARESSF